jgi:uncharacterized protein
MSGLTLSEPSPTSPTERRATLDVLRGFALVGVVMVNLRDFTGVRPHGSFHLAAKGAIDILCSGKFATLFQLMFGIGFAIQIARWNVGGPALVTRYLRRALGLWLIGWAAIILTGGGDTLQRYAVSSLGLLLFWKASQRTVFAAMLILFVSAGMGADTAATARIRGLWPSSLPTADSIAAAQSNERARTLTRAIFDTRRSGTYLDHARAWANVTLDRFPALVLVPDRVGLRTLSVFLLGLLIWRSGVIQDPERHRAPLRRMAAAGLVLGLAGQAAWVLSANWRPSVAVGPVIVPLLELANDTTMLALSLGYGAAVVLAVHAGAPGWLSALGAQGRMGLTVFLLQWLAIRMTFAGFGLGANGKLGYAWSIPLTVVITVLMVMLAKAWFKRYRTGPMESVWHLLTYGPRVQSTARLHDADTPHVTLRPPA